MNRLLATAGVKKQVGASKLDTWSRLEEIQVPCHVLCGDLDLPFLLERSREVGRRMPKARCTTIPGTAHLPFLERPAIVASVIGQAVAAAGTPPLGTG